MAGSMPVTDKATRAGPRRSPDIPGPATGFRCSRTGLSRSRPGRKAGRMKASRVAVLSDIHGVPPALEAVLAEPDVAAADLVVLTGDHAAGPLPVPTLDLLSRLQRAVWVRGNADRELVALARGAAETAPTAPPPTARPYGSTGRRGRPGSCFPSWTRL